MTENLGRGPEATADMKARIAALRKKHWELTPIIETLWRRHHRAEVEGKGYEYEHAGDRQWE